MNIKEYILPELLVLIPMLNIIGVYIKKSHIPDRFIPIILGVISLIFCTVYVFSKTPVSGLREVALALFTSLTQGVLCAGASVYLNQINKQRCRKQ